jgi:hypothetical protein
VKTTVRSAAAAWRRLIAPRAQWPLRHHAALAAILTFVFMIVSGIAWGSL